VPLEQLGEGRFVAAAHPRALQKHLLQGSQLDRST
jgi:hypothetical protein